MTQNVDDITSGNSQRRFQLAVGSMFAASGLALANWFPRIPETREMLSLSYDQLGLALFGLAAGAIISMPVTGWLVSRIGSRKIGMVVGPNAVIALALIPLAPNLAALSLALFWFGGLIGSMDVAMNSNGAAGEMQFGRPILARLHGLFSGGTLVGALMGGAAATAGIPLTLHLAVVAGVLAIMLLFTCQGLVHDKPERVAGKTKFSWPRGPLIALGVIAFAALLIEGAIGDWSAVYMRDRFGAGPELAAAGYVTFAAAMTASRFFGDWLIAKLGSSVRTVMRSAGLFIVVGMGMVLAGSGPIWSLPGFLFVGAGAAMIFPLTVRAASRVDAVAAGAGIAAITVAGYSGLLVGPPLIGFVASLTGLSVALGLLLVLGLLVLSLAGRIGRD